MNQGNFSSHLLPVAKSQRLIVAHLRSLSDLAIYYLPRQQTSNFSQPESNASLTAARDLASHSRTPLTGLNIEAHLQKHGLVASNLQTYTSSFLSLLQSSYQTNVMTADLSRCPSASDSQPETSSRRSSLSQQSSTPCVRVAPPPSNIEP